MNFADIWETIVDASATAQKSARKTANQVRAYDKDDYLAAIGLETKRSAVGVVAPAIGFFAVGILAGVGLGMLFAPKAGYELREDLSEQMKTAMNKTKDTADGMNAGATNDVNPVI